MTPTRPLIVYVDIDDTLIRSAGHKRMPIPAAIQHVRELHAQRAVLYCWSSGGGEYARQSAAEVGLEECFEAFLPKPDVLLDDQAVGEWRGLLNVHPAECQGQSVDSYRERLRPGSAPGAGPSAARDVGPNRSSA
ncbi:MAG TPA: DUF705 domain-containing protein [Longimicrobium sp.]|jgi:hypothetical protein